MVAIPIAAMMAMMPIAGISGMTIAASRDGQPRKRQGCDNRYHIAAHRFSPE
jgi:hypothetical protein